MSELLYAIGTLVSAAAAVLAWVAKLKWSKEFRDAKDATIQAKEDQIKTLQARHEASAAENDAVLKAKDALIAAKDEQVKLLQTEITNLREFSPSKLREYFLTVRQQLEEYNNLLKSQLEEAQNVIKQKQDEINAVKSEGAAQSEAVKRLEKEKAVIEENTKKLQEKVGALEATERPAVFTFDTKILEEIRI